MTKILLVVMCCLVGWIAGNTEPVKTYTLENGLTILVRHVENTQPVCVEMWYNVGSKDEETGERGIAHLIEHMLFKGTDRMSETDIDFLANKIAATWNAATSYDYTRMYFHVPVQAWQLAIPVLADTMHNCSFKQQLLNSELKVVVQELKMNRDNPVRTLIMAMMAALFVDHPYHYPVIGFKQDLWNVEAERLQKFYLKHYLPNNAVLVVVGNVDPEEVFTLAQEHFGAYQADLNYKKAEHYINKDVKSQTVTLYRDLHKPILALSFAVPGLKQKKSKTAFALRYVLAGGQTSRLYKKLVNDTHLADSVQISFWNLFDADVFTIIIEPRDEWSIDAIVVAVQEELFSLAKNGIAFEEYEEMKGVAKRTSVEFLESNEKQAHALGHDYLALRDAAYSYDFTLPEFEVIQEWVKDYTATHLRSSLMHRGTLMPISSDDRGYWRSLQEESDAGDAKILEGKKRTVPVEPPQYSLDIQAPDAKILSCQQPRVFALSNGVRVLYYNMPELPLVQFYLRLKATAHHEPVDKPGLFDLLQEMLFEGGTKTRTKDQLHRALLIRGVGVNLDQWVLSARMLTEDFSYALPILYEIVSEPAFDAVEFEHAKSRLASGVESYWDDEKEVLKAMRQHLIYKRHPYEKSAPLAAEDIHAISREDLLDAHGQFITPHDAVIVLVGNLEEQSDLVALLNQTFGSWQGEVVADVVFPPVEVAEPKVMTHYFDRDQVLVSLAQLSVKRFDPEYCPLALYSQNLFTRLFHLREKTGAFYTMSGTAISGASELPGVATLSTIVSLDRLHEVLGIMREFLINDTASFSIDDLELAKRRFIESINERYASSGSIASTLAGLDKYHLPFDYYQQLVEVLETITVDDVRRAAQHYFNPDLMHLLLAGRIEPMNQCSLRSGNITQAINL